MTFVQSSGGSSSTIVVASTAFTAQFIEVTPLQASIVPEQALVASIDGVAGPSLDIAQSANRTYKLDVGQDITGATLFFSVRNAEVRTESTAGTPLIAKTSADSSEINITDAANGLADIFVVPNDTKELPPGRYAYDVWIKQVGSTQLQIVEAGTFEIKTRVAVVT